MFVLIFLWSFLCLANYQISSQLIDGVTITQNQAPDKSCIYLGEYSFNSKLMAKDTKQIVKEAKKLNGNFVLEYYDNYPSFRHHGKVYKCEKKN